MCKPYNTLLLKLFQVLRKISYPNGFGMHGKMSSENNIRPVSSIGSCNTLLFLVIQAFPITRIVSKKLSGRVNITRV